jgi:uncharacterized protein (TIGR02246 family)
MDLVAHGAELAIRRVLAEYCQLCDDGDFDALAERFTSDGSLDFAGRTSAGRPALVAFFERLQPPALRGKHLTTNSIITVEGNAAMATSDFVFLRIIDGTLRPMFSGRYADVLKREAGRWRIAHRAITTLDATVW